jgi:hypothetical protein
VEGGDSRWRAAIAGGGQQSPVEGIYHRSSEAIALVAGGGQRSQVEGSDRRWGGE